MGSQDLERFLKFQRKISEGSHWTAWLPMGAIGQMSKGIFSFWGRSMDERAFLGNFENFSTLARNLLHAYRNF